MKMLMTSKQFLIAGAGLVALVGTIVAVQVMNRQSATQSYDKTITLDVDHPTYSNIDELKADAPYIFTGTVRGKGAVSLEQARPEDDVTDPSPFTDFTVIVDDVMKGEITDKTITFRQLGGINNRTQYMVENYPVLHDDGQYIFFAIKGDGKYGALAGGYAVARVTEGQFTLKEQTGIKPTKPLGLSDVK